MSENYVDLSDNDVDLSDNDVDLSDLYVDLLDVMSTCQIIWLISTETYNRLAMLRLNEIYCNKRNRQIQMHQSLAICVGQQSLINKIFLTSIGQLIHLNYQS